MVPKSHPGNNDHTRRRQSQRPSCSVLPLRQSFWIYEAKGEKREALLQKKILPAGIEGFHFFPISLIKDCQYIDKLCYMWPDQAAEQAESTWSTAFSDFDDPVPWGEVKENIRKGNVVGSGHGYTLLHAFVKKGNELAVELLLYKGTDVNSRTKSNSTALHLAIQSQNSTLIELLVKNRADPLARDINEMTVLNLAITHDSEDTVRTLLAQNIDVDDLTSGLLSR